MRADLLAVGGLECPSLAPGCLRVDRAPGSSAEQPLEVLAGTTD